MSAITHRTYSDPKHTLNAPTLYIYRCIQCGSNVETFEPTAPACANCKMYTMRRDVLVSDNKIKEIMNRKADIYAPKEKKKGNIGQMWDEGFIPRNRKSTALSYRATDIEFESNFDKHSYLNHILRGSMGDQRFVVSLTDIGHFLHEVRDEWNRDEVGYLPWDEGKIKAHVKHKVTNLIDPNKPMVIRGNMSRDAWYQQMITVELGDKKTFINYYNLAASLADHL